MKNKIVPLVMLVIGALGAGYGYMQKMEAQAQRDEVIKLHRQIKQLTEESKAARIEASKLRALVENERKRTDEALASANKK